MDSRGTSQIGRQQKGGVLLIFWDSWVLPPSRIIWGGIWMRNGPAWGVRPGSPSRPIPKFSQMTTSCPCTPSWYQLLPHIFNYSKLVGIWDGLLVRVRRYSTSSRILSWIKIRIFQVSPQGASLMRSSRAKKLGRPEYFCYLTMSTGDSFPMEPSLVRAEGSDRAS